MPAGPGSNKNIDCLAEFTTMKLMKLFFRGALAGFFLLTAVLLNGCQSAALDTPPRAQVGADANADNPSADPGRFRIGQTVVVVFSGGPDTLPQHEEAIKENGNITLPLIGPIHAEGKTPGELQVEIVDAYVPKYYTRLNVTVKVGDQGYYYVGGEVKGAGRQMYVGGTTVTKAIQSAGGLTEFASHKKVWIVRALTGQRIKMDFDKALEDPSKDLPVYPDDQITVERTLF